MNFIETFGPQHRNSGSQCYEKRTDLGEGQSPLAFGASRSGSALQSGRHPADLALTEGHLYFWSGPH